MRQLASIQRITDIQPIEGADRILVASVLGWRVVVAKAENFKVGDLVCYFEVDSILPERPEFEFLRETKFRIKTRKFKKQISQGLVMPLSILPEKKWNEGQDVTDILGVTKYDPEGELENRLDGAGRWPEFITHTDEDRIQLFPYICETERDTSFQVTEKLDGQSATYFLKRKYDENPIIRFFKNLFGVREYTFGVCSRRVYLKNKAPNNYWRMAEKYEIESALRHIIGDNDFVVLQGEIVGEGIQGNKYGIREQVFYCYNIILSDNKVDNITCQQILDDTSMLFVPIISHDWHLPSSIDDAVKFANDGSRLADTLREGVVVRNYKKGLSFKIINPEFLLKWKL